MISFNQKSFQWNSLKLIHKASQKVIIQEISGKVLPGQFLTIMGPSGAGKTSLLSILTCRITKNSRQYDFKGSIKIEGLDYGIKQFSQFAGYIRQDDILFDSLTVQETLSYQTELKFSKISNKNKKKKVNDVIRQLNLQQCRNTLVGGQFFKTISGGQKKRVCIALQLISDAQCIILDQPTSGLDSHNAFNLIKIFQNLCKMYGKIIIATIHQPSSLMFHQMDKLLLLHKGRNIYFGEANKIVPYMKKLNINVDQRMNPADFFMMEISKYKENKQAYKTPMTSQNFEKQKPTVSKDQKDSRVMIENDNNLKRINLSSYNNSQDISQKDQQTQLSLFDEFTCLFSRGFKLFYRNITGIIGRLFITFLVPIFMVLLYLKIGDRIPNLLKIQELEIFIAQFSSYIYMNAFFNLTLNIYLPVLIFPRQKLIIYKQTSAKLYSLSTYFITKCIYQVTCTAILSMIVGTIIYFSANLQNSHEHIQLFIFVFILSGICGSFFGLMCGIIITNADVAVQATPIIIFPVSCYGGLVVNLLTLPDWSVWVQYISPVRYCYAILMIDQFSSQKFYNLWEIKQIRERVGFDEHETIQMNFIYLGGYTVLLFVICIVSLYAKKKPI